MIKQAAKPRSRVKAEMVRAGILEQRAIRLHAGVIGLPAHLLTLWPGVAVCALIALASTFISEHHGGPALLYALLLGLALNFLSANGSTAAGVAFCGKTLLRLGVALLGARITWSQVAEIGAGAAAVVARALVATILFGLVVARLLGQSRDHGVLSGCAVGICGASAALAVSSILPQTRENERFTLLAVIGVTILSTITMVVYPLALKLLALPPALSGIFLGATIHDVAQVVAAGSLLGPSTADAAVVTKLFRVALLAPVILVIGLAIRRGASVASPAVPLLPAFMVGFIALVAAGSVGLIGPTSSDLAGSASRWLLITAIGASGVKTQLGELARLGWRPLAMLLSETLFLALLVGGAAALRLI